MKIDNVPYNEKDRLAALYSYSILDTDCDLLFDDITLLASQLCQTKIALISFLDEDREWFKSKIGIEVNEVPREYSLCTHAIYNPTSIFIVNDAINDDRFHDNPFVKNTANFRFYAGVPLKNENDLVIGTLCVIDDKPRDLNDLEIKALKTLSNNVVTLMELRKNKISEKEKKVNKEIMDFTNPFFILLDMDGNFLDFGDKLTKCTPALKRNTPFENYYCLEHGTDFKSWIQNKKNNINGLSFFTSINLSQRFKFSTLKTGQSVLLSVLPVINEKYNISNYNLKLNDFNSHDYIIEYIFLRQSSLLNLNDSIKVTKHLRDNNKLLIQSQHKLDLLSRFPEENPNVVLRLDYNLNLLYLNPAAFTNFVKDFKIQSNTIFDPELAEELKIAVQNKHVTGTLTVTRNNRFYNIYYKNVIVHNYLNIYANDITNFISEINLKQEELNSLLTKISEQKQFYEKILDLLPMDLAVFDLNHKFMYINKTAVKDKKLRGWLIGKDEFDYCKYRGIDISFAKTRHNKHNEVLQKKESETWVEEQLLLNKEVKYTQRTLIPLKLDENLEFILGIGIDITDNIIREKELVTKNNELIRINEELDSFVYSTSHDLRSPLLSIKGIIELLKEVEGLDERCIKYFEMINSSADRLDNNIKDIIEISKNAKLELQFEQVNIIDLATEIYNDTKYLNTNKIDFNVFNQSPIFITTDKTRMSIILKNIISNCFKYHKKDLSYKFIDINIKENENNYIISISDNGQGMSKDVQEKIFHMFYRGSYESVGTGLGLYIVKEIVKKLKGEIHVASEVGVGSTFTITLYK